MPFFVGNLIDGPGGVICDKERESYLSRAEKKGGEMQALTDLSENPGK